MTNEPEGHVWIEYQPDRQRHEGGYRGGGYPEGETGRVWIDDAAHGQPRQITNIVKRFDVRRDRIEVETWGETIHAVPTGESDPDAGMVTGRIITEKE